MKVEIRVRPVVRYIVTRFSDYGTEKSCETIGEFDNEAYADHVSGALQEQSAQRIYAVIEETMGVVDARVWYAYDEQKAIERKAQAELETGKSFRIYSRVREQLLG